MINIRQYLTKQTLVGVIIGIAISVFGSIYYYKSHPNIITTHETPTTSTVTINPLPKDYESCIECLKAKGNITEEINDKNVMHITYADKCKKAEKDVTLAVVSQRKNFLSFGISNTIYKDSFKNYGGTINYSYMMWNKVGVSCGVYANAKSAGVNVGIVYSW